MRVAPIDLPTEEIPAWCFGLFPEAPIAFVRTPHPQIGPWMYREIGRAREHALTVICTGHLYPDGRRWMHVSFSRPHRLPSWEDLRVVKDTFVGRDRLALQVLPRQDEYVNIHPHVLHLWSCLDGDPVPDFRLDGGI